METNNENKALKKFMDNDLVDQLFQRCPEENDREIDTKNFDSIEELYFALTQDRDRPKKPQSFKGYDLTLIALEGMMEIISSMKEMASKPQEINITMPEIKPPIINIEPTVVNIEPAVIPAPEIEVKVEAPNITVEPTVIPAPVVNVEKSDIPAPIVNIDTQPPVVTVEASKDTSNVLSAIKSLVGELKKFNKQKPPKFDINVKGELSMPDHEVEVEKVVHRDSLNRIQKTVATRKIVKK